MCREDCSKQQKELTSLKFSDQGPGTQDLICNYCSCDSGASQTNCQASKHVMSY